MFEKQILGKLENKTWLCSKFTNHFLAPPYSDRILVDKCIFHIRPSSHMLQDIYNISAMPAKHCVLLLTPSFTSYL